MKRICLLMAFLGSITLAGFVSGSELGVQNSTEMQGWFPQRTITGEGWLKMDFRAKYFFVLGFRRGYGDGIDDACRRVYEATGRPHPDDESTVYYKCGRHGYREVEGTEHVIQMITQLYEQHPEYLPRVTAELIRKFSPAGMTIEKFIAQDRDGGAPEQ